MNRVLGLSLAGLCSDLNRLMQQSCGGIQRAPHIPPTPTEEGMWTYCVTVGRPDTLVQHVGIGRGWVFSHRAALQKGRRVCISLRCFPAVLGATRIPLPDSNHEGSCFVFPMLFAAFGGAVGRARGQTLY